MSVVKGSVSIDELAEEPYPLILCYPSPSREEVLRRIDELRPLGITRIVFDGRSEISGLKILGKGCVSVVVAAEMHDRRVALKIRRMDADRASMKGEVVLTKIANDAGVGPKVFDVSKNFLAMELIRGERIMEWIRGLKGRGSVAELRRLRELLDQCRRLDKIGLDHGELSNLSKHVFVGDRFWIIDFESASVLRRPSNLTSAVQCLFIGGALAGRARRMLRIANIDRIIDALRKYKREVSDESYQGLLTTLKLSG